jgi:hypothetical protein
MKTFDQIEFNLVDKENQTSRLTVLPNNLVGNWFLYAEYSPGHISILWKHEQISTKVIPYHPYRKDLFVSNGVSIHTCISNPLSRSETGTFQLFEHNLESIIYENGARFFLPFSAPKIATLTSTDKLTGEQIAYWIQLTE